MKSHRLNYVAVGAFVLILLFGLIASVIVLAGKGGAVDRYHTVYDNVGGIGIGTQVRYEGFPIGQVDAIQPVAGSSPVRFRVDLSVQRGWPIPQDSVARIAASGLLAAVSIDIRGGLSPTLLVPGSEIAGASGGGLFSALADIADEVTDLSRNGLRPLLGVIEGYVRQVGDSVAGDTPEILANLRVISADLAAKSPPFTENMQGFSEQINTLTRTLNEEILNAERQQQILDILDDVSETSGNLSSLTHDLLETRDQVHALLAALETLIDENQGDVSEAVKDLRYTLQSVSRHVDSIVWNAEGTSRNMFEFSRAIRANPGLLLRGGPPQDEATAPESGTGAGR